MTDAEHCAAELNALEAHALAWAELHRLSGGRADEPERRYWDGVADGIWRARLLLWALEEERRQSRLAHPPALGGQ